MEQYEKIIKENYKEKILKLQKESDDIIKIMSNNVKEFTTEHLESFNTIESQKLYFDLKCFFREIKNRYLNMLNITKHNITTYKYQFTNIITASELDSYSDKSAHINFKLRDVELYKDTIELYLKSIIEIYKDLEGISFLNKN